MQINLLSPFIENIKSLYQLNNLQVGYLSSSYFLANFLFLLPAGYLLDKLTIRKNILFSALITTLGVIIFTFSHTFLELILGRFLVGIGGAFAFITCLKISNEYFSYKLISLLTGITYATAMIGSIASQLIFSTLRSTLGLHQALVVNLILSIALLAIILSALPFVHMLTQKEIKEDNPGFFKNFSCVIKNKESWLAIIFTCFINTPIFIIGYLWGVSFISKTYHLVTRDSSAIISMMFIGVIIGSPFIGYLADKVKSKKIIMITGSIVSLGLIYFLLFQNISSVLYLTCICFLIGLFSSTQMLGYTHIMENNHKFTGISTSLLSLIAMLTVTIAQPIYSWFIYSESVYENPFFTSNIFILALVSISILSACFSKKR